MQKCPQLITAKHHKQIYNYFFFSSLSLSLFPCLLCILNMVGDEEVKHFLLSFGRLVCGKATEMTEEQFSSPAQEAEKFFFAVESKPLSLLYVSSLPAFIYASACMSSTDLALF